MVDKKIVLDSGPSSGKTSVIKELGRRGYNTIGEMAREVIGERSHLEATPGEIEIRQRLIYERQMEAEKNSSGLAFLDRGTLSIVAYSRHLLGYLPFEVTDPKYHKVCILDRLPFVDDGLRVESGDEEAQVIQSHVVGAYRECGYSPIDVPVIGAKTVEEAISKRTDYLLSKLERFL